MKRTFGVVVLLLLMSSPAWSANINGVTQTWTYDPVAKSGTLHLVNQSGKDVIAYSIGQRVKMPDGSLQLVGAMTKQNDHFAPGTSRDEPVGTFSMEGVTVDETTIDVKLDVVVYADNTAEVTDQDAFERLLTEWKSEVLAMKKTNEVIEQVLADPAIHDYQAAIVQELNRLATIYRNNHEDELLLAESRTLAMESQNIPEDDASIAASLKGREQQIMELEPRTHLKVVH
jgi:hypothetical protein